MATPMETPGQAMTAAVRISATRADRTTIAVALATRDRTTVAAVRISATRADPITTAAALATKRRTTTAVVQTSAMRPVAQMGGGGGCFFAQAGVDRAEM